MLALLACSAGPEPCLEPEADTTFVRPDEAKETAEKPIATPSQAILVMLDDGRGYPSSLEVFSLLASAWGRGLDVRLVLSDDDVPPFSEGSPMQSAGCDCEAKRMDVGFLRITRSEAGSLLVAHASCGSVWNGVASHHVREHESVQDGVLALVATVVEHGWTTRMGCESIQ